MKKLNKLVLGLGTVAAAVAPVAAVVACGDSNGDATKLSDAQVKTITTPGSAVAFSAISFDGPAKPDEKKDITITATTKVALAKTDFGFVAEKDKEVIIVMKTSDPATADELTLKVDGKEVAAADYDKTAVQTLTSKILMALTK